MSYKLQCIVCGKTYSALEIRYRCDCGEMLSVRHDFSKIKVLSETFDKRFSLNQFPYQSGVWRYKEIVLPVENKYIITRNEGNTNLYPAGIKNSSSQNYSSLLGEYVGLENLFLKHLGENPSGSFKDLGITVGITQAKFLGCKSVACASTGNTSAALASYASLAGLKAYVFVPDGKIAYGKLSQALAYGAKTIQIKGDFDDAMKIVQEVSRKEGIYLLNSINPFRLEGQKTIAFEALHQLGWNSPDWFVVPSGNLVNVSAIWKGLLELKELDFIKKLPRIASIQAHGANPFYQSFLNGFKEKVIIKAETIASAIKIGNPVSFSRAAKTIQESHGLVEEVTDQQIMDAKAKVDVLGIGCEPASAASLAGVKKLVEKGIIKKDETVVAVLTGNILKDSETTVNYHMNQLEKIEGNFANKPVQVEASLKKVVKVL